MGSEMCIRDRRPHRTAAAQRLAHSARQLLVQARQQEFLQGPRREKIWRVWCTWRLCAAQPAEFPHARLDWLPSEAVRLAGRGAQEDQRARVSRRREVEGEARESATILHLVLPADALAARASAELVRHGGRAPGAHHLRAPPLPVPALPGEHLHAVVNAYSARPRSGLCTVTPASCARGRSRTVQSICCRRVHAHAFVYVLQTDCPWQTASFMGAR